MTQNNQPTRGEPQTVQPQKKPNENGTISVEGFIKIFDPKTQEKFVEKRA
jgi:hypothetical protein